MRIDGHTFYIIRIYSLYRYVVTLYVFYEEGRECGPVGRQLSPLRCARSGTGLFFAPDLNTYLEKERLRATVDGESLLFGAPGSGRVYFRTIHTFVKLKIKFFKKS